MRRIALIVALVLSVGIALASVLEGYHYHQMHHFVGYGPHIDVVLGDSDAGRKDTYYARMLNLSAHSMYIEGCRMTGEIGQEETTGYLWDIQRWNIPAQRWESLRSADHWGVAVCT